MIVNGSTVLDVYEEALGRTPAQVAGSNRQLGAPELAAILAARDGLATTRDKPPRKSTELWPLISHHTYGARAIFGTGGTDVLPRALTLLLLHDGLVISDPLQTVHKTLVTTNEDAAIAALNQATRELAQVEALIAAGVLRLTDVRPALHEANRRATLEAFGLSPDLRVFTDLLEAAGSLADFPGSLTRTFAPQVQELYRLFGLTIPQPEDVSEAEQQIKYLAACVIEVSWQFAVAAQDPSCDLAFKGRIEKHLARTMVADGFAHRTGPGRHLETLELGGLPNLDPSELTLADAIAVRRDDSFESFRNTVRLALDQLELANRTGIAPSDATATFEEAMREESRRLRTSARRATFRDRVRDAVVPASLGVVTELAVAPAGAVPAAAAAAGVSITTVLWQWILGRQESRDQATCVRYFSMLGLDRS